MASRRRSSFHGRWRCSEADDIAADGEMGARPCVKSRVRTRELGLYGTVTLVVTYKTSSSSNRERDVTRVKTKCMFAVHVRVFARAPCRTRAAVQRRPRRSSSHPRSSFPSRPPPSFRCAILRDPPSAAVVAANHLAKAAQQELAVRAEAREGGRKGTGSVGSVSEDKFERPRLPSKHDLRNSRAHAWRA